MDKLAEDILNEQLEQIVLSAPRNGQNIFKIKIRPVKIKDVLMFQETCYRGTQVLHHNYGRSEMKARFLELVPAYGQTQISGTESATILVSKKGTTTVKRKHSPMKREQTAEAPSLTHNRTKQYILQEGVPVDFLVGLGVQSPDGKVTKAKYDKFRQINRYLEFIEDVLKELPTERTVRIIDFGCGKSYLTFAMYYYLHELQGRDILVTGLDLKEDVIRDCNSLAERCGYHKLHFEKGDISTYTGADRVDMVVSLHACDLATDYAIEKAVKWGARVIMAVPCCQHEVNRQISCEELGPVLKYGLIKERISALITDAVRANLLTEQGYDTQILEFIDMEHTPKNLLIRAVKRNGMRPAGRRRAGQNASGKSENEELLAFLGISPTLAGLLQTKELPHEEVDG